MEYGMDIKLTEQDLVEVSSDALKQFFEGIKSKQTRITYESNLKYFLVRACGELLNGDFSQRANEFVNLAKNDQQNAIKIVRAYVSKLREKALKPKDDLVYLNPSSLPNKIKPIKKLLEMNDVGLPWARIYSMYPEIDNSLSTRGYTREEIQKMLEHTQEISTKAIILTMSSGGFREGAWDDLTWKDLFPIYKTNEEKYKIELEKDEQATIVCGAMTIYRGTPEEYVALISIEAWNMLQELKKEFSRTMNKLPNNDDHIIIGIGTKKGINATSIRDRISMLCLRSGLRIPLIEGQRRHEVPTVHGFRKYWNKIMMNVEKSTGLLSDLVIKERLMGHKVGIVKTDKNYFFTDVLDMVKPYLKAMPELMISDETRLKIKLENEVKKTKELENEIKDNERTRLQLEQLEAKVKRMEKYPKL